MEVMQNISINHLRSHIGHCLARERKDGRKKVEEVLKEKEGRLVYGL